MALDVTITNNMVKVKAKNQKLRGRRYYSSGAPGNGTKVG